MVLKMKSVLFSTSLIFILAFTSAQENSTTPATLTGEGNATIKEAIEEVIANPAKVPDEILNTTLAADIEENTTIAKVPIAELINATDSSTTTVKVSDGILNTTHVEENTTPAKIPIAEIINTTIGDITSSFENITVANIQISNVSFSNQTFVEATAEEIQRTIRYRVKNWYEKFPIYFSVQYNYAGNKSEQVSEVIAKGTEGILDIPAAALNSWMSVWYFEDGIKRAAYGHSRKVHDPRTELCFEVCNFDLARPQVSVPVVGYCLEKSCVGVSK